MSMTIKRRQPDLFATARTENLPLLVQVAPTKLLSLLLNEAVANGPNQPLSQIGRRVMTKICADHLARSAVVYVRQSSVDQVVHNLECQRRQYGLAARARELGWSEVCPSSDGLRHSPPQR